MLAAVVGLQPPAFVIRFYASTHLRTYERMNGSMQWRIESFATFANANVRFLIEKFIL